MNDLMDMLNHKVMPKIIPSTDSQSFLRHLGAAFITILGNFNVWAPAELRPSLESLVAELAYVPTSAHLLTGYSVETDMAISATELLHGRSAEECFAFIINVYERYFEQNKTLSEVAMVLIDHYSSVTMYPSNPGLVNLH